MLWALVPVMAAMGRVVHVSTDVGTAMINVELNPISFSLLQPIVLPYIGNGTIRLCNVTDSVLVATCVHPILNYTGLVRLIGTLPWSPVLRVLNNSIGSLSWTCGDNDCIDYRLIVHYGHRLSRPTYLWWDTGWLSRNVTTLTLGLLPAFSRINIVLVARVDDGSYDVANATVDTAPGNVSSIQPQLDIELSQAIALAIRVGYTSDFPDVIVSVEYEWTNLDTNETTVLLRGGDTQLPLNCGESTIAFDNECFVGLVVGYNIRASVRARIHGSVSVTQWSRTQTGHTLTALQPPPDLVQQEFNDTNTIDVQIVMDTETGDTAYVLVWLLNPLLDVIDTINCTAPCGSVQIDASRVLSDQVRFAQAAVVNDQGQGPDSRITLLRAEAVSTITNKTRLSAGAIAGIVSTAMVCILVAMVAWARAYRQKYVFIPPEPDQWELSRTDFEPHTPIGSGHQGVITQVRALVRIGDFLGVGDACVFKQLRSSSVEARDDFMEEIRFMKLLGARPHRNVIQFYGCVTQSLPLVLVMEYASKGSLFTWLQQQTEGILLGRAMAVLYDIANGMDHIERCELVHRDLAARNCLITSDDTVKVADFGMTRHIGSNTAYYSPHRQNILVPIRWAAPETIETGRHSHRSDVWAYGAVLYEIFSHGQHPFGTKTTDDIIAGVVQGTLELEKPEDCPDIVWHHVFLRCRQRYPADRPLFSEVCQTITMLRTSLPE